MKTSDLLALTSLLISGFTAYWTLLRGPKYISPPLRYIAFGLIPVSNTVLGSISTLVINFPIAMTNVGGQTGVIDSFYFELTNLATLQAERFYAWQEGKLATGQGFSLSRQDTPTPVSLRAGESVVKHYIFISDSLDFRYTRGSYKISVYAYLNSEKKPIKLSKQELEIETVLEPNSNPNIMPYVYSYNLFPKKILKLSNYGTTTSPASQP